MTGGHTPGRSNARPSAVRVTTDLLCAACHKPAPACDHSDLLFAGIVSIDDQSEPGSWKRHRADTACMRGAE